MTSVAEAASQAQDQQEPSPSPTAEADMARFGELRCFMSSRHLVAVMQFFKGTDLDARGADLLERQVVSHVVETKAVRLLWDDQMLKARPKCESPAADVECLVEALPNNRAVNTLICGLALAIARPGEVLTPERALELASGLSSLRTHLRTGECGSSEANYQIAQARLRLNEQCDNFGFDKPPA